MIPTIFSKIDAAVEGSNSVEENKVTEEVAEEVAYNKIQEAMKEASKLEYNKIKEAHEGWKHYFIHDNGNRPFCVYVSPDEKKPVVDIYKHYDNNQVYNSKEDDSNDDSEDDSEDSSDDDESDDHDDSEDESNDEDENDEDENEDDDESDDESDEDENEDENEDDDESDDESDEDENEDENEDDEDDNEDKDKDEDKDNNDDKEDDENEEDDGKPYEDDGYYNIDNYTILVGSYQPERVIIGKSPLNPMTKFSAGYGDYFDGNSILLVMNEASKSYIFIGQNIFAFNAEARIVEFVSPVGNNGVPYPYALDRKGNYYMLIEGAYMKISKKKLAKSMDPYEVYYDTMKRARMALNIEEFTVGDESYNFGSFLYPECDYDRLTKDSKLPMRIKFKGDESPREITRKKFAKMCDDYNESCGIWLIDETEEIHEKDW